MKETFKNIRTSISGSYSQIFFSDNGAFSAFLLIASFVDPTVGLSGLICVLFSLLLCYALELNPTYARNGTYTYNVLLTGLALGANFQFTPLFVVALLMASILSLLLSSWISNATSRYHVPFLSLPFILSIWILFFNARTFQTNLLIEKTMFVPDGGVCLYFHSLTQSCESLNFPKFVFLYLKSMSSIFFLNNIVSGIIISLGLLYYSRIAFTLSWLGFFCGYLFFKITSGAAPDIEYLHTGFNYIFSAIALAGCFLVPSLSSYLLVVLITPLIGLFNTALLKIVAPYYLPLYSLPFSLAVIVAVSIINNRYSSRFLKAVQYQLYSPEKNLYAFHIFSERFKKDTYVHISLPFYGEWMVSQGHSGSMTHKEDWRYAWDFVVADETNKTYKMPGKSVSDFYCYSLPVLAPADGQVVTLEDGIDDNKIGDANLEQNWGNTIVIKHAEGLYSKLSHLKKDSFKVKAGDQVKKGEVLALCGNSGRSPEPHIHFQLQATAFVGAKTIEYPISYFISKNNDHYQFQSFELPAENQIVLRPLANPLIRNAFHFIPGMKFRFEAEIESNTVTEEWEVFTNAYNVSYLYCTKSKSFAYFNSNDSIFYFTSFTGNKTSLLYYFYLAAYKIVFADTQSISTHDKLPVEVYHGKLGKALQDLVAPFYIFMDPRYCSRVQENGSSNTVTIISKVSAGAKSDENKMEFEIELGQNKIKRFKVNTAKTCLQALNID